MPYVLNQFKLYFKSEYKKYYYIILHYIITRVILNSSPFFMGRAYFQSLYSVQTMYINLKIACL